MRFFIVFFLLKKFLTICFFTLKKIYKNDRIGKNIEWEEIALSILLKNGTVIDYASNTEEKLDILIEDEKIVKISESIESADKIIDCTDLYIMPGMIDIHCHLREPGGEHKETIETGSKSAVCGGFTTICPMPNTNPTPDSAIVLEKIINEAKRVNLCNVLP